MFIFCNRFKCLTGASLSEFVCWMIIFLTCLCLHCLCSSVHGNLTLWCRWFFINLEELSSRIELQHPVQLMINPLIILQTPVGCWEWLTMLNLSFEYQMTKAWSSACQLDILLNLGRHWHHVTGEWHQTGASSWFILRSISRATAQMVTAVPRLAGWQWSRVFCILTPH